MKYNIFDLFWARGLRARADLEKIGRDAFLQRKSDNKKQQLESSRRRDLLSFLFEAIDPDSGRKLPDDEIVAESISFIVGGSDTTSSTMTNFIDLVCRTPGLQRRLQTELDQAFPDVNGKNNDWVAPNKVVENLPLLNATLKEVMRYRPTSATGLERITPPGGKVIEGVFLPAGVSRRIDLDHG
jgi:benzoate 4-monooxygenase